MLIEFPHPPGTFNVIRPIVIPPRILYHLPKYYQNPLGYIAYFLLLCLTIVKSISLDSTSTTSVVERYVSELTFVKKFGYYAWSKLKSKYTDAL